MSCLPQACKDVGLLWRLNAGATNRAELMAAVKEAQQGVHALHMYRFTCQAGVQDPDKWLFSLASHQLVMCAWDKCEKETSVQCTLSKILPQIPEI